MVITTGLLSSFVAYHYFSYSSIAPNLIAEYKVAVELDKKIEQWEQALKKATTEENNIVFAVDKISNAKNQEVAFKSLIVNEKGEISIEAVSRNESNFGYLAEQLSANNEQLFLKVKVDKIGTNNTTGEKNATITTQINPRVVVK